MSGRDNGVSPRSTGGGSRRRSARNTASPADAPMSGAASDIAPISDMAGLAPFRSPSVGPRRASASPATGNAPRVNSRSPSNLLGSQLPSGGQLPPGRTPARTPFGRQTYRPDLGPTPVRPMVNPMSSLSDMEIPDIDIGGTGPEGQATTVIWGTDINAESLRLKVERFFSTFLNEEGEVKYIPLIKLAWDQDRVVNLDTSDLRSYDPTLYKWLISYPHEVLPIFDRQAMFYAVQGSQGSAQEGEIVVRPFSLEERKTIRDLNPADIDKLICVEGMVTRTSNIIPDLRVASFRCGKCGNEAQMHNEGGKVEEPGACERCKAKSVHTLVHNCCIFSNKQLVKMQEKPNDIPEGETPHAVVLHVYEANVDVCRPGDRVTITGILRALPIRVNPRQRSYHALFKTYIDVMHIARDDTTRLFSLAAQKDQEEIKAATVENAKAKGKGAQSRSQSGGQAPGSSTQQSSQGLGGPAGMDLGMDEDEDGVHNAPLGTETHAQVKAMESKIRELSQDPRIYERIRASIAPNVWGMEDVKMGLASLLFGGSTKIFPGGRIRGEINLLLVGDPSVSKSQLLSYVHALAPRGIYTSGKGSSAVGLTAYVTRDPETREMVLESGALVLSDRGVCCIDEFDKMSEGARSMLHEAMEQQTVSVAKAGLISTLNARTSVCACANPIGSRYNNSLSLSENINLPPTLLTRFDLIYLVLDKCEEERDRRLARHLVSLFHENPEAQHGQGEDLKIPKDLLKEYIAYARNRIQPKLNDSAIEELVTAYSTLRQNGRDKKVVVATPRQLESLIRLSESRARMRLSEVVTQEDVSEAVSLWYRALSGSAGTSDGTIDMDNIFTGTTTAARHAHKSLPDDLRSLLASAGGGRPRSVDELLGEVQRASAAAGGSGAQVSRGQLVDALRMLDDVVSFDERTGVVRPRNGGGAPVPAV